MNTERSGRKSVDVSISSNRSVALAAPVRELLKLAFSHLAYIKLATK